jgi:hypothetical protein
MLLRLAWYVNRTGWPITRASQLLSVDLERAVKMREVI